VSLAKRFIFHGNYGDEYATMLFHLANGHDYKKFLLKSHDQDHEAASCYPPNHVYQHLHAARQTQTGKESAADTDKKVLAMVNDYAGCISHDQMMGGSVPGLLNPIPSTQLDEILAQLPKAVNKCVVPRCDCENLEKGEFRQWVARLRNSLACKPFPALEPVVESFTEAIDCISEAARRWRIDVVLSCINDDELPASVPIMSTYRSFSLVLFPRC
jgi:rRNA-processing protein FCF1